MSKEDKVCENCSNFKSIRFQRKKGKCMILVEKNKGLNPTHPDWQSVIVPLNGICKKYKEF